MQNLDINDLISSMLSSFEHEDALYCKPASLVDWYGHWDFDEYDANIYNHGLHQYPARFVPQLARKLLRTFANFMANVKLSPLEVSIAKKALCAGLFAPGFL